MSQEVFKSRMTPGPLQKFLNTLVNLPLALTDGLFSRLQKVIGIRGMAYVFVLPNLLIFGIFILLPMILNFQYAFTDDTNTGIFLQDRPYVGFENFEVLFDCDNFLEPNTCTEDRFARAVINTAGFVAAQVGLMVMVSLMTALVLNRKIAARGFFRGVFFFPVLLSPIVVGLLWKWILQDRGVLNAILQWMGLETQQFLTTAAWAQFWVVLISVWSLMGFYTLILLAGLQSIPSDLYEAASIDGAGNWKKFQKITMPLLMPTMLVVLVLALIRAVQVFDVVFAFTNGGPVNATYYIVQYIYRTGFANEIARYGVAAAASIVMATVLIVATLTQLYLQRNNNPN